MTDIIVIGAGAAGLTAARMLAEKGLAVTVLEARDRIGGRIHTSTFEKFSVPVEAGAEFIHGNLPETLALVKEAQAKLKKTKGRTYSLKQGQLEKSDMFPDMDTVMKKLYHLSEDMTMGSFLNRYFAGAQYEDLRYNITRLVQGLDAADVNKASAMALRDEWDSEDESKQFYPVGGYSSLMHYLKSKAELHDARIVLNSIVREVRWSHGHVEVQTQNASYKGAKLICTIPPAVMKTGEVRFTPAIPHQMNAIQKIETGGVIKFLFEFNEPIWERDGFRSLPGLHFLFSDAFVPTWWTQPVYNIPLLTGWLSGPMTTSITMDNDGLLQSGCQSLSYLFGCTETQLRQHIRTTRVINWLNDSRSLGAYAYKTLDTPRVLEVFSQPIDNTIYFAGEAFYEGPEMGTVEAALSSGRAVAYQCTA